MAARPDVDPYDRLLTRLVEAAERALRTEVFREAVQLFPGDLTVDVEITLRWEEPPPHTTIHVRSCSYTVLDL
ncbi:MAG TPA: hypothetical protein VNP04_14420 [Alphaproteobacteria bacterium]|nr:hypothetical protein [Alphaproteobacteria bacterium]